MRNCISWDFGEGCGMGKAFIIYDLTNTSPDTSAWNIFSCGDKWRQSCKTNPVWFVLTRSVFRQVVLLGPPALLGTSCPSRAEKLKLFRSSSTVDLECTNLIRLEGRAQGTHVNATYLRWLHVTVVWGRKAGWRHCKAHFRSLRL